MGEPKKRVSPRIANQVNRDFERLYLPVHTRCSKSNKRPMGMQFDRSSMLGSTNRCGLCFHEGIPL